MEESERQVAERRLAMLRRELDGKDNAILREWKKRVDLALEIGEVKRMLGMAIRQPEIEQQRLECVGRAAEQIGLNARAIREAFAVIIADCRAAEEQPPREAAASGQQ